MAKEVTPQYQFNRGPKGADLERWLESMDGKPTSVPNGLPKSKRLALVADVLIEPEEPGVEPTSVAIVVTSEELLAHLLRLGSPYPHKLFFVVPRTALIGHVPRLTKESFEDDN